MMIVKLEKLNSTVNAYHVGGWWRTKRSHKHTPHGVVVCVQGRDRRAYFATERERDEAMAEIDQKIGGPVVELPRVEGLEMSEARAPMPSTLEVFGEPSTVHDVRSKRPEAPPASSECGLCGGDDVSKAPLVVDCQGIALAICPECQESARSPAGGLYAWAWHQLETTRAAVSPDADSFE